MAGTKQIHIQRDGQILIVTPPDNLRELDFHELQDEAGCVLTALDETDARHVVVDLKNTTYLGSTALGYFLKVLKRVSAKDGRMAFCHMSEHEKDTVKVLRLGNTWPICDTLEGALGVVRGSEEPATG